MSDSEKYWSDGGGSGDLEVESQGNVIPRMLPIDISPKFTQEFGDITDDMFANVCSQPGNLTRNPSINASVRSEDGPSTSKPFPPVCFGTQPSQRLASTSTSRTTSFVATGKQALGGDSEITLVTTSSTDRVLPTQKRLLVEEGGAQLPAPKRTRMTPDLFDASSVDAKVQKLIDEKAEKLPPGYLNVAYSAAHQRLIDKRRIPWGAIYEICRLITHKRLQWSDIELSQLDSLQGTNNETARNVAKTLLAAPMDNTETEEKVKQHFAREHSLRDPFMELDKEDDLLRTRSAERLGCSTPHDEYFAGKVVQSARLVLSSTTKAGAISERDLMKSMRSTPVHERYELRLDPQELGRSTRTTRFYGSRRIIRVSIPKNILNSKDNCLVEFFMLGMIICGRIFRAFFAKERGVYLAEVKDDLQLRTPDELDNTLLNFHEFINHHNARELNHKQTMSKWSSRMTLALSTSIPVVKFAYKDIMPMLDIISPAALPNKPSNNQIMTDGCGFLNRPALALIAQRMNLTSFPHAVQGRLGGAKGMFMLHPEHQSLDDPPQAWIRDSQLKIYFNIPPDDSQLILDLVRLPRATFPSRLSGETIINLAENGVPRQIFIDLLKQGLQNEVEPLVNWDSPNAMLHLWDAVSYAGHVVSERIRREMTASSRARGYGEDEEAEDELIDEDMNIGGKSARWWPDEISGLPATLHETVLHFLQSGFRPDCNKILFQKLQEVVKMVISAYTKKHKLIAPASVDGFILPDPLDPPVLQPDEIYFRFAKPVIDPVTGNQLSVLEGDCIVGRHPTKLPTDMRKVQAVNRPELQEYLNVVIFPVLGDQSLASFLGGGDYDGDTVSVIWEPSIVNNFTNADPSLGDPPEDLLDNFETRNESTQEFIERISPLKESQTISKIQNYLLASLKDTTTLGTYSGYHDLAIYRYGYGHPETLRLAHMFTTQLDGGKSGLRIKHAVKVKDGNSWGQYDLEWKQSEESNAQADANGQNKRFLDRQGNVKKIAFVMDELRSAGVEEGNRHLSAYQSKMDFQMVRRDEHLVVPWIKAQEQIERLAQKQGCDKTSIGRYQELECIKRHVENIRRQHREVVGTVRPPSSPTKAKRTFTETAIQDRQDSIRALSRDFAFGDKTEYVEYSEADVARLRASYAYIHDFESSHSGTGFPWDVAFRTLSEIKSGALGSSTTMTSEFGNKMIVAPAFLKASESIHRRQPV